MPERPGDSDDELRDDDDQRAHHPHPSRSPLVSAREQGKSFLSADGRHSYQQSYIVWRCVGEGTRGSSHT